MFLYIYSRGFRGLILGSDLTLKKTNNIPVPVIPPDYPKDKVAESPYGIKTKPKPFFRQGYYTGDCGLLGGGGSLAFTTKKGAAIINDSVFQDSQGNTHVTLQGVDEKYTFSPRVLSMSAGELSIGDDVMRAIELAAKAHELKRLEQFDSLNLTGKDKDNLERLRKSPITAKYDIDDGCRLLTKNYVEKVTSFNYDIKANPSSSEDPYLLVPRDPFKNPDLVQAAEATNKKTADILDAKVRDPDRFALSTSVIMPINMEKGDEGIHHGMIIVSVNKDSVFVANTWDTSIQYEVPREVFMKKYIKIASCDLDTPAKKN